MNIQPIHKQEAKQSMKPVFKAKVILISSPATNKALAGQFSPENKNSEAY